MNKIEPETINKTVWNRLAKIHQQNRASGAYLFIGPKGLGKIDLAFSFICLDSKINEKRELVEGGGHPDVILIKPQIEEKKGKIREKQISIDQVKEGLKLFSYYPQESQRKFLVIESIDKLTLSAANALLKTVEELDKKYIVIMTSSNSESVLKTIKSRSQKIFFNLKSPEEISEFIKIQKNNLETNDLEDITFLSRGRIKESLKLLRDDLYKKERMEKLNSFRKALKGDLNLGFEIAKNETKDKIIFEEYLNDWVYYLNSFLKRNIFESQDMQVQKKIFKIFNELVEVKKIFQNNPNVNSRLLLENFFIQIK